jgi:hypothetical protein
MIVLRKILSSLRRHVGQSARTRGTKRWPVALAVNLLELDFTLTPWTRRDTVIQAWLWWSARRSSTGGYGHVAKVRLGPPIGLNSAESSRPPWRQHDVLRMSDYWSA